MEDPRAHLADQLVEQSAACASIGSRLYAHLLDRASRDVLAGGPVWRVFADDVRPGRGDAAALRLMAAVHRLVLDGTAPELAPHYPSVGGDASATRAWEPFRNLLEAQAETLRRLTRRPCQTNEVGRCAALAGGFLEIAATARLPLRLLEVGASAGLNLRWDAYRYGDGGALWGDPASPVDLTGLWSASPPHLATPVTVVSRRGCDPAPVDPLSEDGRRTLLASVWADQTARFQRLHAAVALAPRVPAVVDADTAADWARHQLARPVPGVATVVFQSVVGEYLSDRERARFAEVVLAAGQRASGNAPLAWLRLEPVSSLRRHTLTLTTWPGERERTVATAGAHGQDVVWE